MGARQRETPDWTVLGLAWLAAFNFRAPLIGVGPVLPLIVTDTHLSHTGAGLLFSLPVLMFGLCSIPGGLLADRFGAQRLLTGCLFALALFGGLRAGPGGVTALLIWTCAFGMAIGLAQPALPKLVQMHFFDTIGTATALYSSGFMTGALTAAAITIPWLLPALAGWSWRGTFIVWAVPAAIGGLAWLWQTALADVPAPERAPLQCTLRNPLLWLVITVFLGINLVFFTMSSWLPAYYHSLGWSLSAASVPLTVVNLVGLVAGLAVPWLSDQLHARRPLLIVTIGSCLAGTLGLLTAPLTAPLLWSALIGVANGAVFALCLTLAVDLATDDRVGAFTGLMLTFGNSGAIAGPLLAGALRDVSGSFTLSIGLTVAISAVMLVGGFLLPESYAWTQAAGSSLRESNVSSPA